MSKREFAETSCQALYCCSRKFINQHLKQTSLRFSEYAIQLPIYSNESFVVICCKQMYVNWKQSNMQQFNKCGIVNIVANIITYIGYWKNRSKLFVDDIKW